MASQLPSVPESIATSSPEIAQYLESLRQAADNQLQALGNLVNNALTLPHGTATLPVGLTDNETPVYYGAPPMLLGVVAGGAINHVMLRWNSPNNSNHSHVEVWRATSNYIVGAERIGTTYSNNFSDEVDPGKTYFYWVRAVSKANVLGPWQSDEGVQGSTEQDSAHIIDVLTTKVDGYCVDGGGVILHDYDGNESGCTADGHQWVATNYIRLPFKLVEIGYCINNDGDPLTEYQSQTTCDAAGGAWVEPGVYMDAAWIIKASITSAHIAQLYADDIDVDELSAFTANLGDVVAGTLKGPRGNFQVDLWKGQLNVFDDTGQLRVRLGELGEIVTSVGQQTIKMINEMDYRPPGEEGVSILNADVYQWIETNKMTQIEFWTYLMQSDNKDLFVVWAKDAAGLCSLMTEAAGAELNWSCA